MTPADTQYWIQAVQSQIWEYLGTSQTIMPGTTPVRDVHAILNSPLVRQAWFVYPRNRVSLETWNTLWRSLLRSDININITTSDQISRQLGIEPGCQSIPRLWVVSLERTDPA